MNLKIVEKNIKTMGRDLEKARYDYFFNDGKSENIVDELKKYQNEDGGFGNALESDVRMPNSSAIATSVALQIMNEIKYENCEDFLDKTIQYLENTFNYDEHRWYAVPSKVNEFPRAPWWDFDEEKNMTVIDYSFGNPTAEILGFLLEHKDKLKRINIEEEKDYTINQFIGKENYNSEHEVYSYLRMYNKLSDKDKNWIKPYLDEAIISLVTYDQAKWGVYVPQPVHFLQIVDDKEYFGIKREELLKNLEYISQNIRKDGYMKINFEWGRMPKEFEKAKNEWIGVFTLQALLALDKFNYL